MADGTSGCTDEPGKTALAAAAANAAADASEILRRARIFGRSSFFSRKSAERAVAQASAAAQEEAGVKAAAVEIPQSRLQQQAAAPTAVVQQHQMGSMSPTWLPSPISPSVEADNNNNSTSPTISSVRSPALASLAAMRNLCASQTPPEPASKSSNRRLKTPVILSPEAAIAMSPALASLATMSPEALVALAAMPSEARAAMSPALAALGAISHDTFSPTFSSDSSKSPSSPEICELFVSEIAAVRENVAFFERIFETLTQNTSQASDSLLRQQLDDASSREEVMRQQMVACQEALRQQVLVSEETMMETQANNSLLKEQLSDAASREEALRQQMVALEVALKKQISDLKQRVWLAKKNTALDRTRKLIR